MLTRTQRPVSKVQQSQSLPGTPTTMLVASGLPIVTALSLLRQRTAKVDGPSTQILEVS
jgi:hypothetical protein